MQSVVHVTGASLLPRTSLVFVLLSYFSYTITNLHYVFMGTVAYLVGDVVSSPCYRG